MLISFDATGIMADSAKTLSEIARLGSRSKTRRNDFSAKAPSRWEPQTIENPETGIPFSDSSAWEFICQLLQESPERFREVKLKKPPDQVAYWATVTLPPNNANIYIKIQLSGGFAYGRSFHISTRE